MKLFNKLFASDKTTFRILLLGLIILSILYSLLSVLRHIHFQSGGFDLGIYDQSIWQYSRFLFPYNTIKDMFILGDHFTLTLPLLAPLYWINSNVNILLIFQAFWVSFSAIPIYLIAKKRNLNNLMSFFVSILYVMFYGMQYAVYFDFHPIVIGIGFLAWLVYLLENKNYKLMVLFFILAVLTQEDIGLAIAGIGIIYLFRKKYRKISILLIVLGIFSSLMEAKLVGLFSPIGFQYIPKFSHNPMEILRQLFDDPQKIQVWKYSLGWFSFLPIFSPGALIATVLNLMQFFTTGPDFIRMWSPYTHHRAILSIFLTLGLIDVLVFINKRRISVTIIAFILISSAIFQQFYFHYPLNKLTKPIYWNNEAWMSDNEKLISQISPNKSIATTQNLSSHLTHRSKIYLIYPRKTDIKGVCNNCWWLDFAGKPNYLFVDLRPNQLLTQLLESNENFISGIKNMENSKKITKIKNINYATLYKINY